MPTTASTCAAVGSRAAAASGPAADFRNDQTDDGGAGPSAFSSSWAAGRLGAVTTDPFELAAEAAAFLAQQTGVPAHDVALVLGSGWGEAAGLIGETTHTIPAADIPGFSAPAVEGHVGTIRSVLTPDGKRVLVLGARTHYYEGKGVRAVVHGVRTAAAAGCKTLVLTNGCGGLNPAWAPGYAGADQRSHQSHRRLTAGRGYLR